MPKKTAFYLRIALFGMIAFIFVYVLSDPAEIADAVRAASGGHSLTKEYNWCLQPREDGQPPQPGDRVEFMEKYDAFYMGDPSRKVIYLTFDAGYENGYTAGILDTLKKHGVPAAFFLVGHYIRMNPQLVNRMKDEGHLVCNHTMRHKNMAALTDFDAFRSEIEQLEESYEQTTGSKMPRFYRPPEGKFSELSLKYAQDLGYSTVFWSFAYVDWYNDKQPSREEALSKIMRRTHPGELALLHANSKTNAQILDEVLTKWKETGYTFGALHDIRDKTKS